MKFGSLLIRNSIFRALNIIAGVLITFILLRLLSIKDFGLYALMMANAAVFNLFTCMGAESGILYNYSSGKIKSQTLLGILFFVTIVQAVLLLITEGVVHRISGVYWITGRDSGTAFGFGFIYLLSLAVTDKYAAMLNAAHLYTLTNKILLAVNICLLSILFFYLAGGIHKDGFFYLKIIISATAFQAVLLMAGFHILTKQPPVILLPSKNEVKLFFSYSFIAFITNCIQFLAYRIDYWILDYYHGADAVGIYAVAVRFGQLFWVFPLLFATIILPKTAAGKDNEGNILSLMRIAIAVMASIAIIGFVISPFIIPWAGGNEYVLSVTPFLYLLPGIFFFSITIMLAAYFAGVNKLWVNFTGSLICLLLVLVFDFILIPVKSAKGAAIASGIAYSLSTFYTIIAFARYKRQSVFTLLIINKRDLALVRNYIKSAFN